MMQMMSAGAIRHAMLQSDCYHQQSNTQLFYRPGALPVAQQHSMVLLTTSSPGGLPSLTWTSEGPWLP